MDSRISVQRERIERVREALAQLGAHALLVPSADPHLSEYLPERWQGREWLSGFTGSMITAVAKNLTGDINNGTYALGACLLVSCMLILLVPRSMLTRAAPADASKPNRQTAHAAQRASGSTLPMTER